MLPKFNKYIEFIKGKAGIQSAFSIVLGTLISNTIQKIANEIITPLTRREKINFNIKEYFLLIFNLLITTYILFIIIDYLDNI